MPKSVAERERAYSATTTCNKSSLHPGAGQSREYRARLKVSERQRSTDVGGESPTADDLARNAASLAAMNCASIVFAPLQPRNDSVACRHRADVAATEERSSSLPLIDEYGGYRIGSLERGENDSDRRTKKTGAERARRYRERKRAGRIKRSPKSAAQRARDYRERKKLTKVRKSPKTPAQRAREYRARKKAAELKTSPRPTAPPRSVGELSREYERQVSNAVQQQQQQQHRLSQVNVLPGCEQLLLANYRELLSVSRILHDRQLIGDPFLYQFDKRLLQYDCLVDCAKQQPAALLRENLSDGNAAAKKPPKTAAERVRAYRARKKAGKVKKPAKTPAERARACRARKMAGKVKKPAKTPAERSREYRARQKILKTGVVAVEQRSADYSSANHDEIAYPPCSLSAGCSVLRQVDRGNNYRSDGSRRTIDVSFGRDPFVDKLARLPRSPCVEGGAATSVFHRRFDRDNGYSRNSSFNGHGSFDDESAASPLAESDRIVGRTRKTPAERAREYRARKKLKATVSAYPSQTAMGVCSANVLFNQDVYMVDRKIPVMTSFVSSSVPAIDGSTVIDAVDAGIDNLNLPDDTNAQIDFISSWSFKHFMAMK